MLNKEGRSLWPGCFWFFTLHRRFLGLLFKICSIFHCEWAGFNKASPFSPHWCSHGSRKIFPLLGFRKPDGPWLRHSVLVGLLVAVNGSLAGYVGSFEPAPKSAEWFVYEAIAPGLGEEFGLRGVLLSLLAIALSQRDLFSKNLFLFCLFLQSLLPFCIFRASPGLKEPLYWYSPYLLVSCWDGFEWSMCQSDQPCLPTIWRM